MRKGAVVIGALCGAVVLALLIPRDGAREELRGSTPPTTLAPVASAAATVTSTTARATAVTGAVDATTPSAATEPDRRGRLRQLAADAYLGWFDAIFRSDPVALATWVAGPSLLDAGLAAIAGGTIAFTAAPAPHLIRMTVDEVLRDEPGCVVLRTRDDVSAFIDATTPTRSVITVYWPDQKGRFRTASRWSSGTPATVWETDCGRPPEGGS